MSGQRGILNTPGSQVNAAGGPLTLKMLLDAIAAVERDYEGYWERKAKASEYAEQQSRYLLRRR